MSGGTNYTAEFSIIDVDLKVSLAVFTLLRECHLAITDPLILHLCFLNTDMFFCKNSKMETEYFLPFI